MGEREQTKSRPGHYWDHREAGWVPYAPPVVEVLVPAQPSAVERPPAVAEDDVRSG